MNEYYIIKDLESDLYVDCSFKLNIFKYRKEFFGKHEALVCIHSGLPAGHYTVVTCYRTLYSSYML